MQEIDLQIVRELLDSGELELIATQNRICLPIIRRLYKKMMIGINFEPIRVVGDRIVDGHHRYISSILSETEIERNEWKISSTAVNHEWGNISIVEEDYETPEVIQAHNERDAELNNVEVDVFKDL